MNDAYYEQLVARKSRPLDMVIRFLTILVIVAVAVFGMPFLGIFSFFLAVGLAFLAYYFIFPRLDVEYEYVLLNHDMQVDAIYSKAKRKKMMTFDIQQAEIMAPKASPRLHSYQPAKTYDFSSGRADAHSYSMMLMIDQKLTCIVLEPDEKMMDHMKSWMGMKLYMD